MSAPITHVTGGVNGLAANYDAVRALADRFDVAGDRMREWAVADGKVLVEPALLESAPLSPVTFAEAEEKLLAATSGIHGVLVESVVCEADALLMRATVGAFEECDRLVADSFEVLDYAGGRAVGCSLAASAPYVLALGAVAVPALRSVGGQLPAPVRRRLEGREEAALELVEEWVDEHPAAVQHVADATGGLLDGLLVGAPVLPALIGFAPFHPTAADAAADLAALYGAEGPPRVRRRKDLSVPLGNVPPYDVAGLMEHLAETNDLSPADRPGDQGTIEIQTLHAPDGSVRHIVYLPGTDDLGTTPWSQDADVRDMAANLHLIAGQDTTYAEGIQQAMAEAGIRPHDPVLLVGHSQGGMEAAAMLSHGTPFHITHVVTAGSPIAQVPGYPPGSHVLSLENRGDVVPLLDGHDNSDSVPQVTVQFDDHETSIAGNHDLRHYVAGAAAVDASGDPSIREQLASLQEAGFLGSGATCTSQVFQISR